MSVPSFPCQHESSVVHTGSSTTAIFSHGLNHMQKHALKFRDLPSDLACKETGISFAGLQGWKLSLEIVLVIFFSARGNGSDNYCNFPEVA